MYINCVCIVVGFISFPVSHPTFLASKLGKHVVGDELLQVVLGLMK